MSHMTTIIIIDIKV